MDHIKGHFMYCTVGLDQAIGAHKSDFHMWVVPLQAQNVREESDVVHAFSKILCINCKCMQHWCTLE
jgi:hypothetical protein